MDISINDLCLIPPSKSRRQSLVNSIDLAVKAENFGFKRVWYGEHHASHVFSSCSPEVLIPMVASYTSNIKLGSGGILLNYYSPYKVAETFLLMSNLFPGRIDLGIGRSSNGSVVDAALGNSTGNEDPSKRIVELTQWLENGFPNDNPFSKYQISNLVNVPELWMLGSSLWSAEFAARFSLPFVFADFFNSGLTKQALAAYHSNFRTRKGITSVAAPKVMLSCRVICADSEADVRRLLAPVCVMSRQIEKDTFRGILSIEEAIKEFGGLPTYDDVLGDKSFISNIVFGTPEQVEEKLHERISDFEIREILIQDLIAEHDARVHSYELISKIYSELK